MNLTKYLFAVIAPAALAATSLAQQQQAPQQPMSFFVTSVGSGDDLRYFERVRTN